jgi:peptide-methionine (S)-S-oxide reductase
MPTKETALPDRPKPVEPDRVHYVSRHQLAGPFPGGFEKAMFAMGCFWGPEHMFWDVPGIWVTAVGYSGGFTVNPTYEDVKTGRTGHAEVVRLVFDPKRISYADLLKLFWENHDPTSGMKQGEDEGTQYRSAIYYVSEKQKKLAERTRDAYQAALSKNGFGTITTEIAPAGDFYFAEAYHQAYFAKNASSYCGMLGTGIRCPIGLGDSMAAKRK